eukprot:TRINITY_DN5291_c0_g1_i1.p1 TRINITY_DN5291_c0_g1~~TRINITY_DN5291_c0_g1_i1.p1  ORF type:complete len:250 (-),score=32.82 TRINITY_DN5291_c0_g1_i1:58-807(-)
MGFAERNLPLAVKISYRDFDAIIKKKSRRSFHPKLSIVHQRIWRFKMEVAIFFGSKSDTEVMRGAANALKEFGISYKAFVLSAHRVPEKLEETLEQIEKEGCKVIIAGAGLAAHLPGVIASKTILPVIGVPVKAALEGVDALYSIVQMPKSIPVATVGINNSYNAGMLAVQMLSVNNEDLKNKLKEYRTNMKKKFIQDNAEGVELQWKRKKCYMKEKQNKYMQQECLQYKCQALIMKIQKINQKNIEQI